LTIQTRAIERRSAMYTWTIWSSAPVGEGNYELTVSAVGPKGSGNRVKVGHARAACLMEHFKVKEGELLAKKSFESPETNAAAAIYDLILNTLNAPNN